MQGRDLREAHYDLVMHKGLDLVHFDLVAHYFRQVCCSTRMGENILGVGQGPLLMVNLSYKPTLVQVLIAIQVACVGHHLHGGLSKSQWHVLQGSSSHGVASSFALLQQPHIVCLLLCCRQTLEDLKVAKVRQAGPVPPCTPWACLKLLLTHCSRKPVAAALDCPPATLLIMWATLLPPALECGLVAAQIRSVVACPAWCLGPDCTTKVPALILIPDSKLVGLPAL